MSEVPKNVAYCVPEKKKISANYTECLKTKTNNKNPKQKIPPQNINPHYASLLDMGKKEYFLFSSWCERSLGILHTVTI